VSYSTSKAVLPFYKGSLIIEGTKDTIVSITYSNEQVPEQPGINEVHKAYVQMNEYLDNKRQLFDLNIHVSGTNFQQAVYNTLQTIQFHQTVSYQELATLAGYPKAARAVGQAMASNKLLIVVPCHRVLASNNKLGGFSGGLDLKRMLLTHEGTAYKE
jgi:O-6-methylguanine DNA methyltransferase